MENWTFNFGKHKGHTFEETFKDASYTNWVHKMVKETPEEKQNKTFVSYVKYCKNRSKTE